MMKKPRASKPQQAANLLGSGAAKQAAKKIQARKGNSQLQGVMAEIKKTRGK